jgi:hypothetical protein
MTIPNNYMGKHVPNHQPVCLYIYMDICNYIILYYIYVVALCCIHVLKQVYAVNMGSSSQSKPQEMKTFGTSKQLAQCRAAHLGITWVHPVVDNRLIAGTYTSRIWDGYESNDPLTALWHPLVIIYIAMNNPPFIVEFSIQTFIHRGFLS